MGFCRGVDDCFGPQPPILGALEFEKRDSVKELEISHSPNPESWGLQRLRVHFLGMMNYSGFNLVIVWQIVFKTSGK